jgi:hypothetical protein
MKARWALHWPQSSSGYRKSGSVLGACPGILLAVVPAAWALLILKVNPYLAVATPCLFRQVSGYACPGCGFTRAAYSFMTGDWGNIASMNAGFPLFGGLWLWCFLMLLSRKPLLSHRVEQAVTDVLIAAILVFGVVRNLAIWPWPLSG